MGSSQFSRRHAIQVAGTGIGAMAAPLLAAGPVAAEPIDAMTIAHPPRHGPRDERTIMDALTDACSTMQSVFNPDDHDRPWFGHDSQPDLDGRTYFYFSGAHDEAHVPGRHLLGLLEAGALGVRVSPAAIAKHRQALYFGLSRDVPLPQNRVALDSDRPTRFLPHNIREGLHGLLALYQHVPADAAEARSRFHRAVAAIDTFWSGATGWDEAALQAAQPDIELIQWNGPLITGAARAIGPLVRFYQVATERGDDTADVRAMLDDLVAATLPKFPEGGVYSPAIATHVHSVTCTLSGLARYATVFDDRTVLARVREFYRLGLGTLRDRIGWSVENATDTSDRGECNNSGDILETALLLAAAGDHEYWSDAAAIIGMHLLPNQLLNTDFLSSPRDPWNDAEREVDRRIRGAWGFPAPYGHRPAGWNSVSFNLDIVGGASSSLALAQRAVITDDEDGVMIGLPYDARTDHVSVRVRRSGRMIDQIIHARRTTQIRVAVPTWADPQQIRVRGASADLLAGGSALDLGSVRAGGTVTVTIPAVERTVHLGHHRWDIRARARGDRIVAMDCPSGELAAFPAYSERLEEPARGLLARWSFAAVEDGRTEADDARDDHRITLHAGAVGTADPDLGGVLSLPAAGAFGVVGGADDLQFGEPGMTIAGWLRSTMAGKGRVVSRGSFGWTTGYFMSVGHGADGCIGFGLGGGSTWGGGGSVEIMTTEPALSDGGWHHVAVTVDHAPGHRHRTVRIFLDGQPRQLRATGGTDGQVFDTELRVRPSGPAVGASNLPLTIGSHLGTDEFYVGDLADLRFYGRGLTASEVRRIVHS